MRTLITGITGFAGEYLTEHLLAAGDEVLGCSRAGVWPEHAPPQVVDRVPLLAWDLAEAAIPTLVRSAVADFAPERVFHLAAMSVPADCGQNEPTPLAHAVNTLGTALVAELAAAQARPPRLLFASSTHVYAPVSTAAPVVDESWTLSPRSGYGVTKRDAERLLAVAAERGLQVIVARAFQHCGPRQSERLMLASWVRQFVEPGGRPIRVYNRTTGIDLVDVRDVVRAYRLLIERGTPGQAYNIGSGRNRLTGDVLEMIRQAVDPAREIVELYPGVRQDPIADTARLRACTGWQPEIPLERTIADVLAYWRACLHA